MNSTRRPCSRNHSAIAVATNADLRRTRLGASLVAQTTTERARPAGAQRLLEELDHLAAALADQADHVDVGLGLARDLAHQRRLADARAGEQPEALPLAHGQQRVDRAHAQRQRAPDRAARDSGSGAGRSTAQPGVAPRDGAAAVDRARRARRARGRAGPVATEIDSGRPVGVTSESGPMPAASPSGISTTSSPRKPTTSACRRAGLSDGAAPAALSMYTSSPTRTPGMVARTRRPVTSLTRPG